MKRVGFAVILIVLLARLAIAAPLGSLGAGLSTPGSLSAASCGFYDILQNDYLQCLAGGPCYGDIGTLARNGGSTSKFYKICNSHILNLLLYCNDAATAEANGNLSLAQMRLNQARTEIGNMISANENMIGQTTKYCWTPSTEDPTRQQVDCDRAVYWFGANNVSRNDVLWGGSWEQAKRHIWQKAYDVGYQKEVGWSATSFLAELYNRANHANVCE